MPYRKKYVKKTKANKMVTKAQVTKMIKRDDPNALPSWKSIFGSNFSTKIYRYDVLADPTPAGGLNVISSLPGAAGVPVPNYGAIFFTLNYLDLMSTFSALFDQFRIVGVDVTFRPMFNVDAAAAANTYLGEFITVEDYDDANVPTSIGYLRNYKDSKITNTMTQHRHRIIPAVAIAVYNGAFTGYGNQQGQWMDVASPSTQFYGIKWGFTGGPGANVASYAIDYRYKIEFRKVR